MAALGGRGKEMIIQCDKCQTKYRLDDSKVTGAGVKVKCTKCQNIFIVAPPEPEITPIVEEPVAKKEEKAAPPPEAPKQKDEAPEEKPADEPGKDFDFDFGKDAPKGKDAFDESDFSLDDGKAGGEFSFDSFGFDDKKEEPKGASANPFEGLDIDFDKKPSVESTSTPSAPEAPETSSADSWDLSFRDDETKPDEESSEVPEASGEKGFSPQAAPMAAAGYGRAGLSDDETPAEKDAGDNRNFSDLLDESVAKGGKKPAAVEEEPEEEAAHQAPKASAQKSSKALLLALLLIIGAGAAVYFSGVMDMIAGKASVPVETVQRKNIEIEEMKGYFAENKDLGKIFVVEAKVKNTSDDIQRIKAATAILYNSKGEKISERSVSPGRVVTQDELKNLSKDDLLKPFADGSGGIVPPRGTVPVMVLFTEMPEGMAEYGIDIVK